MNAIAAAGLEVKDRNVLIGQIVAQDPTHRRRAQLLRQRHQQISSSSAKIAVLLNTKVDLVATNNDRITKLKRTVQVLSKKLNQ
jgi:hypothetical protein